MKNLISVDQLDKENIQRIFQLASYFEREIKKKGCLDLLKGKIMASLFFEPSTRTRFSFEAAMLKLGGEVISESSVVSSSISKGETLTDTIKTIERYVDIITIRHPEIGSAEKAADCCNIPLINAGDGAGEHPTQALLDLYTIIKEKRNLQDIKIALVGDLKNSRTVHSLIKLLNLFDTKVLLISPEELKIPADLKDESKETNALEEVLTDVDVIYMTRIQKERFKDQKEYENLKDSFQINKQTLEKMKKDAIILHPLPRNNEIHPEVDSDPRAKYFDQVENGLYVRMALLAILLNKIDIKDKVVL